MPSVQNGELKGVLSLDDFIVTAPNPTFEKAARPASINPNHFLRPTIIVWEPCIFWNYACSRIPCAFCSSSDKLSLQTTSNGWTKLRRVHDVSTTTFLVTKKYTCQKCNRFFLANHPHVMKLLLSFITSQYPCILTKKKGVSKELMNLIEELAVEIPMAKLHSILQLLYGKQFIYSFLLTCSISKEPILCTDLVDQGQSLLPHSLIN
jgi:hypothetical protein